MKRVLLLAAPAALAALLLVACGAGTTTNRPGFDGMRAYGYLERQVAFGPRVPGSDAWRKCLEDYRAFFQQLGFTVDSLATSFVDPQSGQTKPLVNLIVHIPGKDSERLPLLFAAHWDSRPRCDQSRDPERRNDSLPGANDGASGVAVLMELANGFTKQRPACNIDLVLLDGEDWGEGHDMEYYFLGARAMAEAGVRGKYFFGILIDMIGDSSQQIYREIYSETYYKGLNDMVWNAAHKMGIMTYLDSTRYPVEDDHIVLGAAGLPIIDLIDFDNPYWHTELDTPDKCSPMALSNVGRVLAEVAYDKTIWPKKP